MGHTRDPAGTAVGPADGVGRDRPPRAVPRCPAGRLALGLYTGGILGRLVAEAWESIDTRPRDALRATGAPSWLASVAAVVPPSYHHLLTYMLYRFEICIRDTAIVGVVGAAGLGQLLADDLAAFRWPAVTTLLVASFALSVGTEILSRRLRRALRA